MYIMSRFKNGLGNWQSHYFNTSGTNYTKVVEDYKVTATANYNMDTEIYFDEVDALTYVPQTNYSGSRCDKECD